MAAGTWTTFYSAREYIGDGTIDLDGDTFKVGLLTSSATPSASAHTVWGDLSTYEVSNAGYSAGGFTITQTWTSSSGVSKFDSDNPSWTASGAEMVSKYAVLYDTTASNALVAYCSLDSSDVTTPIGATLLISISDNGYFSLTQS